MPCYVFCIHMLTNLNLRYTNLMQEWKGTQSCWPFSTAFHRYRFVHQIHIWQIHISHTSQQYATGTGPIPCLSKKNSKKGWMFVLCRIWRKCLGMEKNSEMSAFHIWAEEMEQFVKILPMSILLILILPIWISDIAILILPIPAILQYC